MNYIMTTNIKRSVNKILAIYEQPLTPLSVFLSPTADQELLV
jgi:hypothetical protein